MSEDSEDGDNGTSFTMKMVLSGVRAKFPTVNQINTENLCAWIQNGSCPDVDDGNNKIILLDTRGENEHRVSHIKDATRIDPDLEEVTSTLREIIANNEEKSLSIVCYCSVGYRSTRMAERLSKTYAKIKRGDRDIPSIDFYNLEGSLFKWANESKPMVDINNKPTIYAHPFSVVWGKLLNKPLRKSSL
ncbi:uncharacterized protein LOC141898237 [Tubulanus polymorphus]|uniref:uncharacterized protein LOC141898237 n=1 Tax=Tubulanus polymorphus TaxID=672921 RepID=UPI003DA25C5C